MSSVLPYSSTPIANREITQEKQRFIWKDFSEEQEDLLSFMEKFDFPKLSELKTSLINSGHYTSEQVKEIIAGLSTLPEYNED